MLGACAHRFGALALSAESKSERALGSQVFSAGAAADLAPLGDLYASQVRALCRWYTDHHAGRIPASVLEKFPPAGSARAGEGSLPSYEVLDPLLIAVMENGMGEDLIAAGFDADPARRVFALIRREEAGHRRNARILQLAARDFGVDRRIPSAGDRGTASA